MAKAQKKSSQVKTHKYQITIEFESTTPVKKVDSELIQFENALSYLAETTSGRDPINGTFVYGTGKARLKKVGTGSTDAE